MQFCDYKTTYEIMRDLNGRKSIPKNIEEFYKSNIRSMQTDPTLTGCTNQKDFYIALNQWINELQWYQDRRPYYNVFPGIIPHIRKLKEDKVRSKDAVLPIRSVLFRLPKNYREFQFDCKGETYGLKSILAVMNEKTDTYKQALTLWLDWGETMEVDDSGARVPVLSFRRFILEENSTMEESINFATKRPEDLDNKEGVQIPPEFDLDAIRMVVSCCLLSQDIEDGIIEPEVLASDKEKWEKTKNPELVEKAKRRGKLGWNIGANIESVPHWRGPSPLALYWTGKGRTVPKYRYRKGAMVHRNKVKEIPHGRFDDPPKQ
jgi:hypothetical protein